MAAPYHRNNVNDNNFVNITIPAGNTITNPTTETNFANNYVLLPGLIAKGSAFRLTAFGTYSSKASGAGNCTFKIKLGSTAIAATAAIALTDNMSGKLFKIEALIVFTTSGATAAVEAQGIATLFSGTSGVVIEQMVNTSTTSIDTTASQTLQIGVLTGTSDSGNIFILRDLLIEPLA